MTLQQILAIDPNNKFIIYIVARLQRKNYRGWHVSQQNRYGLDVIKAIIESIHDVVGTNSFSIPPGDYDKNDTLPVQHKNFEDILKKIQPRINKGTINSIRKNLFPDMDRMGFLERDEAVRGRGGNGKLTKQGIALMRLDSESPQARKMFLVGLEKLFGDNLPQLIKMLSMSSYWNDKIDVYELMFILSDKDKTTDKIGMLNEYKKLDDNNKARLIILIKSYADQKKERDFGNWKNQTQQMLNLMDSISYIEAGPNGTPKEWFRIRLPWLTRIKYFFMRLMCKIAQSFNKKNR